MSQPSSSTEAEPEAERSPTARAVNFPPQLAKMLPPDTAMNVAGYMELIPGIPWTKSLMEDLLHQIRGTGCGCGFAPALTSVPGYGKIEIVMTTCTRKQRRKGKEEEITSIYTSVRCYRGVNDYPPDRPSTEHAYSAGEKDFPYTEQGIMHAFEFVKSTLQYLKNRGFCADCLQLERPRKRIRLMDAEVCGQCLLKRAAES